MTKKQHLPLRTSAGCALATLAAALCVTGAGYHLANQALESWIDHRAEVGILPPWEDPKVNRELASRSLDRPWDEVRIERLSWIAPSIFATAGDLRSQGQKFWLATNLPFVPPEDPRNSSKNLEPLHLSQVYKFFDALEHDAKISGGSWPRNKPLEAIPSGDEYLHRLLLSGTRSAPWRDSFAKRLRGIEIPAIGRDDDPTAWLRQKSGLRDPVQPRPFEGDLWQLDRDVLDEEAAKNKVALEVMDSFVSGMISRLQEAAAMPRRLAIALNGPIQWCTILVGVWCAFLLLVLILRTRRVIRNVSSRDLTAGDAEELVGGLEQQLDERPDTLHDWLLVMVPMLGFIGTIVGMTLAMANAGEVATAQTSAEVRRAVDRLAGYLGTAFDTTLVGLLISIWLDGLRRWVRMSDSKLQVYLRKQISSSKTPPENQK